MNSGPSLPGPDRRPGSSAADQVAIGRHEARGGWSFPIAMWAASRLLIYLTMFVLAPRLAVPAGGHAPAIGWALLAPWDGGWYGAIAARGYEYLPDGAQHSLAFFPLYPLIMRLPGVLGLPWPLAGALVSNLAFLAALLLIQAWVETQAGRSAARWSVAVLAWCPYTLFTGLVYTEGLFLALSGVALWAFERQRHGLAAVAGALATATRITALPLIPAMLITAWQERRPVSAYLAAAASSVGLLGFMVYCRLRFGDPLAFLAAQHGWRAGLGFDWRSWLGAFSFGLLAPPIWNGTVIALMIVGGTVLLARRRELSRIATWYGLGGLALIVLSGNLASADRYVFGLLPLGLALGLLLSRHPRWGGLVILYFVVTLIGYAVRMAQGLWVA